MIALFTARDDTPVLREDGLVLRGARWRDYKAWRDIRLKSRAFLKPYEPRWSEADLSPQVFRARLRRCAEEAARGTEYSFLIFRVEGRRERLVGGLTLSHIRRRAAQHASLGYWMGVDDAGKGIMTVAVRLCLGFAFESLDLHRVHAACLPDNQASRRVLEKNGFKEEGYAEGYLQIDGAWRDHILFGLTRERYLARAGRK